MCVCVRGSWCSDEGESHHPEASTSPAAPHPPPRLSPLTPHPNSSIIRLLRERGRQGCFLLASASSLSSKLPLKALSAMQGCFVKLVLFCFLWLQHDHDTGVHTDDRNWRSCCVIELRASRSGQTELCGQFPHMTREHTRWLSVSTLRWGKQETNSWVRDLY